jgi:hypothetical protein
MIDLCNVKTGETRRYDSMAVAQHMASRLGPDWKIYDLRPCSMR